MSATEGGLCLRKQARKGGRCRPSSSSLAWRSFRSHFAQEIHLPVLRQLRSTSRRRNSHTPRFRPRPCWRWPFLRRTRCTRRRRRGRRCTCRPRSQRSRRSSWSQSSRCTSRQRRGRRPSRPRHRCTSRRDKSRSSPRWKPGLTQPGTCDPRCSRCCRRCSTSPPCTQYSWPAPARMCTCK